MLSDNVSSLIGSIYTNVEDGERWNIVMQDILATVGGKHMFVAHMDMQRGRPSGIGIYGDMQGGRFQDGTVEYHQEMHQEDPINQAARHRNNLYLRSHDLISDPGEYRKDPYLRWNEDRFGSAFWNFSQGELDGIRVGMSLHRTRAQGAIGAAEAELQRMLHRHVVNALTLRCSPPLLNDEPTFVLNGRGDVIGGNDAAYQLLDRGDALKLVDRRLRAIDQVSQVRFDAVVQSALNASTVGGVGGSIPIARHSSPPLLAVVLPLDPGAKPFRPLLPAVSIKLIDGISSPAITADWRALFGFSPAETRLAAAMLEHDESLRDVAARLGISYATARAQLAALFDKADVRSQAQLMKLLMRLR